MNFFTELENSANKKKYQAFIVELGIEKFKVAIPFDNCQMFESEVNSKLPKTKKNLSEILSKVSGKFLELTNE